MRKTSAALVSLTLAALALTGCSVSAPDSFDGQACDRPASTSGIDDSVTVEGDFGVAPDVEIAGPVNVTETSYTDILEGAGTPLTTPQQLTVVDIALYNGETGAQITQTEFDGSLIRMSNIDSWAQQVPGIGIVIQCAAPGTRVLAAISPEDFGEAALTGFNLGDDTTVIAVIDVLDTKLARAEGSLVFNDARSLPTVVRAPDGRPGIIVPRTDAPAEQVTQVLIKGDGPEVTDQDAAVWTNYTSVGWDTREEIATTWGTNPVSSLADVSPALAETLVGQTVGSQLLVVEPGADGAPATVYVVDILGTTAAPEQ
ncbi:FKBP-type peptidyl-prolyl cis-trans isomerase [Microbacterium tumbae]